MQEHGPSTLPFYTQPAAMTSPGRYAVLFESLPREIAALTAVAQGLVIHEHIAPAYGVHLSDADREPVHVRPIEGLLERIVARNDEPLTVARPPEGRVAGNCRHFTVLMVAMLRAQGTPARARCGFGTYFNTARSEDHWVCEYWHADERRWRLVDAQIDDVQRGFFAIDFDLTDVPRDRFLIAGDAWASYRAGAADPDTFGLSVIDEGGDWWIAGNLMRDAAALGNVELLPWDVWGAMPGPGEPFDDDLRVLFDHLAELTQAPDERFADLRKLCDSDDRIRVPAQVHNVIRQRDEPI
jgi:hypothetical protein